MPNTFHPVVPVVLVNPDAPMPTYAHEGDAAMDLCSMEDVTLAPGETVTVGTGIAMAIPAGYAGYVYARSGTGKRGLVMANSVGVIDSTYRGEIHLILHNNLPTHIVRRIKGPIFGTTITDVVPNEEGFIHVRKGDRVGQIVIDTVCRAMTVEVSGLDETERGTRGLGSTGVRGRL